MRKLGLLLLATTLCLPLQAQRPCETPRLPFNVGELQDLYKTYNRTYWDGKLPANATVVWTGLNKERFGETTTDGNGRFVIRLDVMKNRERNVAKTTILHEMCHVKTYGQDKTDHGPRWLAELHRIMLEGAFDDLV